ncbi:MAG: 3-keto-disaccharide hydrolase [Bryobacteraceae bacterium]
MVRVFLFLSLAMLAGAADTDFNGRWDITVPHDTRARAWWLEIVGAGTPSIHGKFVGAPGGQLDEIPEISVHSGQLEFAFERRYSGGRGAAARKGIYRARLVKGKLAGEFEIEGNGGSKLSWIGVRAPKIADLDDGSWKPGKPVDLFDGRDLDGWRSRIPGQAIGWSVKNGLLSNGEKVPDLVSGRTFWNFALHVEYRIGAKSNSGIGLRGRYEIQIFDDYGQPPSVHGNGALYSRIAASRNASRPPGEWQSLDIRLIGRQLTVVLNDVKILDRREIEGLTAIANNADEAAPGPIILQGDHGPIEFRNIVAIPLTR